MFSKTEKMITAYNNDQPNTLINALSWTVSTLPLLDFFGGNLDGCKVELTGEDEFTVTSPKGKWKVCWHDWSGRYFASQLEDNMQDVEDILLGCVTAIYDSKQHAFLITHDIEVSQAMRQQELLRFKSTGDVIFFVTEWLEGRKYRVVYTVSDLGRRIKFPNEKVSYFMGDEMRINCTE